MSEDSAAGWPPVTATWRTTVFEPPGAIRANAPTASAAEAGGVGCLERSVPANPRGERDFDCEWHFVEHHIAHLASAFFPSGFEDAAVLSVDAFGDGVSTMLAAGRGAELEVLERVAFPHS